VLQLPPCLWHSKALPHPCHLIPRTCPLVLGQCTRTRMYMYVRFMCTHHKHSNTTVRLEATVVVFFHGKGVADREVWGQGCRQGSPWLGSVTCHCCGAFRIQPILFVVRRYGNAVVRQCKIHVRSSIREIQARQEKELDHTCRASHSGCRNSTRIARGASKGSIRARIHTLDGLHCMWTVMLVLKHT
jgi:hypothetical protein